MFSFFKIKNYKSQGIIESLVAITVVVVGLVSVLTLVVFNLRVQVYSHDMLIATNLAKEGIEVVRSVRDTNWMNGDDWDQGLIITTGFIGQEKGFLFLNTGAWNGYNSVYYQVLDNLACSWEDCVFGGDSVLGPTPARMYIVTKDNRTIYDQLGFLNPLESVATKFYRVVFINEICLNGSNQEHILTVYDQHCEGSSEERIGLQIISKVGWNDKDTMRTVEAEEWIYNWR